MYRSLFIAVLTLLFSFATITIAADKVVVIPLGGNSTFCDQAVLDKGEFDCDYYCDLKSGSEITACKDGCDVMFTYFSQKCS